MAAFFPSPNVLMFVVIALREWVPANMTCTYDGLFIGKSKFIMFMGSIK